MSKLGCSLSAFLGSKEILNNKMKKTQHGRTAETDFGQSRLWPPYLTIFGLVCVCHGWGQRMGPNPETVGPKVTQGGHDRPESPNVQFRGPSKTPPKCREMKSRETQKERERQREEKSDFFFGERNFLVPRRTGGWSGVVRRSPNPQPINTNSARNGGWKPE